MSMYVYICTQKLWNSYAALKQTLQKLQGIQGSVFTMQGLSYVDMAKLPLK